MPRLNCKKCDGMGMLVVERADGGSLAQPCEACREDRRVMHLRQRVRIPERFLACTLENYDFKYPGAHRSLETAFVTARNFVREYPHDFRGLGLLFAGPVGTGKTHLAVGILQALIAEHRVSALFCDNRQLLKAINNSYNPRVDTTESEVLKPVFEAEVLILDELGSAKQTEWVSDMIEHILNTRYNEQRVTIITTNYPNLPVPTRGLKGRKDRVEDAAVVPAASPGRSSGEKDKDCDDVYRTVNGLDRAAKPDLEGLFDGRPASGGPKGKFEGRTFAAGPGAGPVPGSEVGSGVPESLVSELTLGDRIGTRMFSRLAEMCVAVKMEGKDYRLDQKRASFASRA